MTDANSSDEMEWSLARREFLADERERLADERETLADERDALADAREADVDLVESDGAARRRPPRAHPSPRAREAAALARASAREARRVAGEARDDARHRRAEARAVRALETPTILARLFSDIARQLFQPGPLDDVLLRVAHVATDLVPGCEHASITVASKRGPVTVAATDDIATAADERQYEAGEGPCLDAMSERVVYTPELGIDPRWPRLDTDDLDVQSVASFGLHDAGRSADDRDLPRASLNLYGAPINAMPEEARELGLLLAAYASVAVSVATERDQSQQRDDELHAALLSRDVIGQAKGILMERDKLTADEAFDILRRTSQACNRKLRDVAERLALTGELPPPSG